MSDSMDTRLSKAEWRIEALESSNALQDAKMAALGARMEEHHREVMAAIGSLRDDRARQEGAMEERLQSAQRTRDRMKAISVILGLAGLLATLGWLGSSEASVAMIKPLDAPPPYMPPQRVEDFLP